MAYTSTKALLPERLAEARMAKNLTQRQLSILVVNNNYAIKAYEAGISSPVLDTFFKLSEYLDVCPYYLAGYSNVKRPWKPMEIT